MSSTFSSRTGSHRCGRSSSFLDEDVNQLLCVVCSISSRLNCVPFDYDCGTQKLIQVTSRWRKWMWHGSVFILFLYARFLLVRIFQTLAHLKEQEDARITINHVILVLFFLAFLTPTAFQINIWIQHDEICSTFNQVMASSRKQKRQLHGPSSQISLYDRIKIIFLPVSCYVGAMVMLCVYIVRPDGNQFLFSMIPRKYQTWWAFAGFLLVEALAAISVVTTVMFQHVIQVVMMKSCSDVLLHNCAQTPIGISEFTRMVKSYQVQQFLVTQFNRCFSWNMHVFKLASLTISATCNFMLIRYWKSLDHYSFFFITICGSIFPPLPILLYEQAFRIFDNSWLFKWRIAVGLRFLRYRSNQTYFMRRLNALPTLNVRAGQFYSLNKTETLFYVYMISVYTVKCLVGIER